MSILDLHMAMRLRDESGDAGRGRSQAALRERIARETPKLVSRIDDDRYILVHSEAGRIFSHGIGGMPPPTDDVALLLDAIAFKIGATARADAWRHIGISPDTGRGLLGRNSGSVTWPIWFTLRHAALGE